MVEILPNIIFSLILIFALGFFVKNIQRLIKVIKMGKPIDRTDNPSKRLSNLVRIALGQSKIGHKTYIWLFTCNCLCRLYNNKY